MGVRFVPPSQSYSGFVFFQSSDCGAQVCIHSVYMPMHDVTPKVVAIAVSTVMITCNTLLQISFFSMMCLIYDL